MLVEQFESFSSQGETIGVSSFASAPNGSFSVTGVLTGLFTGDSLLLGNLHRQHVRKFAFTNRNGKLPKGKIIDSFAILPRLAGRPIKSLRLRVGKHRRVLDDAVLPRQMLLHLVEPERREIRYRAAL